MTKPKSLKLEKAALKQDKKRKKGGGHTSAPWLAETRNEKVGRSHNGSSRSKKKDGIHNQPQPSTKGNGSWRCKNQQDNTDHQAQAQLNLQDMVCFWEMGNGERLNG